MSFELALIISAALLALWYFFKPKYTYGKHFEVLSSDDVNGGLIIQIGDRRFIMPPEGVKQLRDTLDAHIRGGR